MKGSPPGQARETPPVRPILATWLVLATITTLPYLSAVLYPPAGRTFVGTFHWIDDFHNYVSFVQQSEDGRFLFENKLIPEDRRAVLVNLEWWVVGKLSRLCGRRPFLAYRLFALIVLAAYIHVADRILRRGGVPITHRMWALVFVFFGGGLGGLLFSWTTRDVSRCVDLSVGIFPFLQLLANPHWLAGTWLLLEALLAFGEARTAAGWARAALLGTALSLTRPYDFAMLGVVLGLGVVLSHPPRQWWGRLLPLLSLLPAVLYNYWLYYQSETFEGYASTRYGMASIGDFLWALGPACCLALLSQLAPAGGDGERRLRRDLWLWAILGLLLVALRPLSFAQQFTVGLGFPLLALAAMGLSRFRPPVLAVAVLLMSSTALVALRIVLKPDPNWFVPRSRREAAAALRASCQPGDVVFAPADIGLSTIALTSCKAYLSHGWAPNFALRSETVRTFYASTPAAERAAILDRVGATHVVLPGDAGMVPEDWLTGWTSFRRLALVGAAPAAISVYVRAREGSEPPIARSRGTPRRMRAPETR